MTSRTVPLSPPAAIRFTMIAMGLFTASALLVLSGCSGAPSSSENDDVAAPAENKSSSGQQQSSDADAGTATVSIDGREFAFNLQSCVFDEDREVELSGPGGESGSDTPSHLDGGLTQMDTAPQGEFRIDIGTDRPFQSSDEFLAIGSPDGIDLTVSEDSGGYLVTGDAWDDTGSSLGTGTLRFTCR